MEIIAVGYIALSGVKKIVEKCEEDLLKQYRKDFIDNAVLSANQIKTLNDSDCQNVESIVNVGNGGIFAALWDLGENLGCGMEINLRNIPIKQETVLICNLMDVNPYELESKGCYLLAVNNGIRVREELSSKGYIASIIGYTTDNNDRVINNGEQKRFIEKNRGKEELERIFCDE